MEAAKPARQKNSDEVFTDVAAFVGPFDTTTEAVRRVADDAHGSVLTELLYACGNLSACLCGLY